MAAHVTVTRMLVVCLLSRAVDSSALDEAGSAADRRPWQGGMYANRRPLQYVAGLRAANQNKQPVQAESRQKPPVNISRVPSPAWFQSQPGSGMWPRNPSWKESGAAAASRAQKVSPALPGRPDNRPQVSPRGFLFDLKVPLLSSLIPKKDTSNSKDGRQSSDPPKDEHGSVEIHSGFSFPSSSSNGAKDPNGKPKPSFHLKLVVPVRPSVQPQTAPSSAAGYEEGQKRASSGLFQSSHAVAEHPTSTGAQGGASSSAGAAPKRPDKMLQGISTLFGARRPVETSASGGRQPTKPVNVKLPSGSTLFEAQRPLFSAAGATPQSPNKPLWARPTFGVSSPSWGSAGGGPRETYQPGGGGPRETYQPGGGGPRETYQPGGGGPQETYQPGGGGPQETYQPGGGGGPRETYQPGGGGGPRETYQPGGGGGPRETYQPGGGPRQTYQPGGGGGGPRETYQPGGGPRETYQPGGGGGPRETYQPGGGGGPRETYQPGGGGGPRETYQPGGGGGPRETYQPGGGGGPRETYQPGGGGGPRETYLPVPPKLPLSPTQMGAGDSDTSFGGAVPQVDANRWPSSPPGPVRPHWGAVGAALESRSTLFGAGRPSLSSAGGVQERTQTYNPKPQLTSTIPGTQRPLLGSVGGNRQYTYTPPETKPQSGSGNLGAQGPAWGSVGGTGGNRQYSSTPVETKPQSGSGNLGALGPAWGSAGAAQQNAVQPADTNLQSGRPWPSWNSASGTRREQMYGPVSVKPHPGSGLGGSRKPSWGDTGAVQQNSPTHKPTEMQAGSTHTGMRNPSVGFTDTTQHRYKPVEAKPHVGSALVGVRPPSSSSSLYWQKLAPNQADAKPQTSSTQVTAENPSGGSESGGQQVYQPTDGGLSPSGGLSRQQSAPVHHNAAQTPLSPSPDTESTDVYSAHMTPVKPDSLKPISSGSTNSPFWPPTNYEGPRRGFYSVQEKPSGSDGAGPPSGLGGSPLPGASRESVYNPAPGTEPWSPTVLPPAAPYRKHRPPFVLDRDSASSSNYDPEKMVELVQKYFSGGSRGNVAPPVRHSSALPSSNIWRPSSRLEFQTGSLSLDGRNRYSQPSSGDGVDGWNDYSVHLGTPDDGVHSPGSNVGRRPSRPDAPALIPTNSRRVDPHDGQLSSFAHHLQPSERSEENVPGGFQPVIVKIRKHDLLIV